MIIKKLMNSSICFLLLAMLNGCIGDDGNYTYIDPEELTLTISDIKEEYHLKSFTPDSIKPVIDGLKENENYSYTWYVFSTQQILGGNKRDTIGRERNLYWNVPLKTGEYKLVFAVKNETTQVESFTNSIINVTSEFGKGWYVLKDNGTETDLDIIDFNGSIKTNVYSQINGRKLPGKGVQIASYSRYGYETTNAAGATSTKMEPVMMYLSEQDASICEANNLSEIVPFEKMFVVSPEKKAPQALFPGSNCFYFINAGKIYNAYTMFLPPHKLGHQSIGDYEIQGYHFLAGQRACLMFDMVSKSLIIDKITGTIGYGKHDPEVNPYDCNNMNCELVYLTGRSPKNATEGVGIFRKDGEYYIAELNNTFENYKNPIISWNTIPPGKEIIKSDVFAINANNGNKYVYFVNPEGQISSYSIHDSQERSQIASIPQGEKVVYMNHLIYKGYNDEAFHTDCFVVLTNSQSGWQLYTYSFVGETGDLIDEPTLIGKGEGYGRYVFYRSLQSL